MLHSYNPFKTTTRNNRKMTLARRRDPDINNYKGSPLEESHVRIEKRTREADRNVQIYMDKLEAGENVQHKLDAWKQDLQAWLAVAEEHLPNKRLKALNKELIHA